MYFNRAVWVILAVFRSLTFTHGFVCGPELVCDAGWTMSKTAPVCYLPVNVSMSWEFASLTCESVGASLIKIEDETENCEIRNYFQKFWIGLSRSAKNVSETVWNGKEVVSDREGIWDVNQPDTDENKLKCVAANKNHLGRWSYEDCLLKMPFVCKKKSKLKGCFQCPNGDVIPPRQLCDDENDCGDNSDEMNCSSKCRYLYTRSSGDITYNPYEDKKTCQWKIVGPIGSTIKLMVKKGTSFEMNADFITIPQTLTNGLTGPITEDRIYYSRNNILRITLNSDNSQTGPFVASWLAEKVVENWKLTATTAVKKLTLNSLPYKQYEWIITAENKNVITLQFESVTLDKSSGSFLKFFDGDQPVSVNYNPGEIYVSRSKSMRIVLVSYSASNQLSVPYNQGCTTTASSQQTFNIASPGFQEDNNYGYPNDVYCEWKISALSNYPASIKFSEFDLKLNSDYLAIKNRTADLHLGSGFSGDGGKIKETVFRSTDGYFMLGFTSDMALTAKGFQAQYSIDCKLASSLAQWTETEPTLEEYTPFDTEITVTCMTGYQFKQEEYNSYSSVGVNCMKGGSWNVTKFPDCEISHCGTPPAIDYGYILSSTGVTYNNTATYKCDEGFTIDKSTIECQADGKWETKPKCTASGCTARALTPNLNYTIIDGGFQKYGNVLQFFCEPGYQIIGSLRIYCKTKGWSHDSPMCKEITCPIPMVTEGSVKSDSGILFGKMAPLQCNSGYYINGTKTNTQQLTCGTDGTFNDPQGEKSELLCTDIDECEKGSSLNTCKGNQTCVNNLGGFTCLCKEGYKPDPDPNKDCININECQKNNGGCGHTCKDETPGYSCTCITGYELYMYDGFNNISLAEGEDGKNEGDVYYINHTCVRKQCPQPVSPKDGVVLSKKQLFYFEDTVEYKCNHGYKMNTSSPLRTCGPDGKWNSEPPGCEVATCKTLLKLSDVNINRVIPREGVEINYGEVSIIECNYGTKFINRTQYCSYNGSDTYDLLGDSSGCPVIDCGQPVVIPGSSYTMPTPRTTYGNGFTFSCQTGFKEEGISTQGNMKVTCEENGRWGMGNLTCTGDMCADPGTPGGAYQVVTSYEVGELLYFQCKRNGYQPVPPEPFLCQIESGNVKWNNTQLPACKDVTDPVFSNCPSTIIYVDYMEQVSYTIPTATDNSGVVKNTSVSPAYMKPNTVIKQDTEVTYYAEDYAGNRAMCSIQIKIKQRQVPTLQCVSGPVAVKIQNSSFVNSLIPQESLVSSISNSSNLTIPSLIPFNSLSNPPKEIKITAMDTYGTTTSCSVLSFPLASACFEEGFPTTLFSQRICTPGTNDSLACNVTCDTGYIFYDGKQSQTYQCEMADSPQPYQLVTWTPRSSPNYCLRYSDPAYRVEIEVTYSISGGLAKDCIADHDTKLKSKEFRDALAAQLKNKCSTILTVNNNIEVEEVITTAGGFTITSKLVSVIPTGNAEIETTFCTDTISFQLKKGILNSYLGYNSSLNCTVNTASASVSSAIVSSSGNLCSSGTIEKTTDLGTKCVPCQPGSYFTNDSCVDCPEGQYQDVAGQLQCKMCGAGKSPSGDQTTCIDLCPKGFINDTIGQVPFCVPCLEDTYWLNSTYCQPCPTGYKTFSTAAKSESDCKAPCGEGNYSTTGYEPCIPCPVNYYQDKTGQKTCAACKTNEITENTGTSNSSFCIDQTPVWCNTSQTQCSGNGDCSVIGHIKYCACKDGYKGDNCENENNPCDANPCFNGGNCIKTGVDTYNCSCPFDDTCRMVRETGNWIGTDDDVYNFMTVTSIEACEKACIGDTQCKAVAFSGSNCARYRVNTVAVANNPATLSTLSRKVCDFTVLFTGDQCETDAVDSCTNNTECGNYGMCQDGLGTVVDSKVNPISSFKCLCQKEGEFEEGNRCKKKQDLCSPNPCENNGKCVQFGDIRRHCECLPGYTGENCSKNIDECKIHPNGCLYDGECKDGVNSYTCTCKTGFGGDNCQTAANLCTLDPRCTNGLCYNNYDNYTAVCVCEKPYQLATNGKCVLMDPCMGVTCQNGTCKNGKCECQTGYEGSQCQHDIDDCKNEPCKNGAQCIDKYNLFECKCKSGYEGTLCDQNVDDCVGSCENSTTISCQDKVADFECICMKGYKGKNCSEEINECDSYPCKHESECIDQVGDYKCNCTAGWTGKDCGTPVDYCKNNPCQNGGNCHNLINGYFCRCKPGTRGDNCDIFPKVCNVTIPCTSNGVCWDTDGTAKCNCTDNYTGVSCNLIKDSCEEKVCKNGGTCQTKDLGFQCLCPGGYSGPTCEVYTDPCSGSSKCHSTAMCKSEYEKYLCLCAQGKTLTGSGCKATFEDWDMLFDSKIGRHGALSLTPFMLGTSEYTVAFRTRFKVNDDQPEPVLIRMLVSSIAKPLYYPIDVEDLSKLTIFKVTNDSVYTSNGTEETTVKLKNGISDGNWHHVGVIWKSSGELEMSVDAVRQISTGVQSATLPKYIQLLIGQNLNGRLSRVTVWQTALSFVDIVKASADLNYKPTGTIAQGWTNYMLSEGSERRYPSKVKQIVCDLGLEDATCNNKYKEKPEVGKCPSDKEQYSSTRLTKVDDLLSGTDIVFSSNYSFKVHENFPSDRYFGYGAKSYYAFAIDEYGNSAECTVRVVVKRSSSCITNNGDYKEPIYCDGGSSGSGSICDLQCKDNTLLLSQPVPKIFKCGNLGTYYTESVCENKPYNQDVNDFVLPSCGGRGAMKRRIEVKLQYRFQVSCISSFSLSLKNDIGTTFNSQISDWSGICPIVSSVCSTVSVTATCSTTQSAIADVLIKVSDLSDAVSKGGAKYTPIEAFRVLVFIERKFSYPNIGASVLVNETALIEEFKSCGPGYAIVGQNCVQCPAGSYYDSSTYSCKFCDIGNYQNQAGQPSCISCGGTKTTLDMGSSKTSDCVEKCLPGTYYETGKSKCEQCPIHHYQDEEGKTYCLGCAVGKKTSGTGSNSSSDCYDDCIAGTELKLDGSCQSCPRGYYRSLQQDKCEKCKNSSYTTKSNGTKSEDFCDIRICYAGTYRNASINECQDCPVGEYQPEDLQDSCKSCDPSYSTKDKGNVNETSCIFYCNPGEEVESASAKKCRKCDRGKYKDNSGNTKFDMCMPCPEGNTTVGIGSTSLADCIITYCSAGTFRNTATNQCENCTRGQYTDKDLQEKCESCENNYFTRNEGSDNKTDCEYHCDPGKQLKDAASKLCEPCPRGFYRDNKVGFYFELCQACPEGNTTISEQSTSVNNCSILNCTMGQLINFYGGCDNCPVDTFQPDDSPTTSTKCQDCPSGTATKQEGSSIQSQCEPFCIAGKQYNNVSKQCEPCPKGTYNNGNDTMKFDSCMQCPENYTTPDSGSISVASCSLLDCDPGYKISGESCQPCGFGFYNSKRHQTECLKCTTKDTNTSTETSTNATDCQLHCPPGKSGSISCETCKDGFIKPNAGLDDCGECLGNYTSNANRTACDKLFCDKGYYYNATGPTCLPCDKGSYKDYKGNHGSCTSCDPGWTTAEKAANDKSKCDQKFCIKGKEYNSSIDQCVSCAVGYFKDTIGNDPCKPCWTNLTTTDVGSTDVSQCSIIVCEAGQKRTDPNTCVNCAIGTYQKDRGQTSCTNCGIGKTTMSDTSKSETDCVPLCKAGEEYNAGTKTCSECDFGHFKTNEGNNVNCTKCLLALKTTKTKGSTKAEQCTEDICGAGTKRVSNQGCVPCPRGEYQHQQEKTECWPCGSNQTTVNSGSTSSEACIVDCPDGKSYNYFSKTCSNCDIGWYTNKTKHCCKCIQCPDDKKITVYAGSNICIQSTVTTPAPRGKRMLKFSYTFRITLDCETERVRLTIVEEFKKILRRRLILLSVTYITLCKDPECTTRMGTLRIPSVNCHGKRYKRSTEGNVIFNVEIPDVEETVKDSSGTGVKTNDLLVEDFKANKDAYKKPNFEPEEISQGEFVKICNTGDMLDTTSNTCKPCPKGTFFNSTLSICVGCQKNTYQDQEAQSTCKSCTGIKKHTINVNSTSASDCVSECAVNSGYCQNGGTCNSDDFSIFCTCTERYQGTLCQNFKQPVSNTEAIIGGAVGGGAALLLIILLIVGICVYFRTPRDTHYQDKRRRVYDIDDDLYRNPLYDNRSNAMFPPQMNRSFVMDDFSGDDAVYNPYSKNPGRPTGIDEDHSEFRWKPTS